MTPYSVGWVLLLLVSVIVGNPIGPVNEQVDQVSKCVTNQQCCTPKLIPRIQQQIANYDIENYIHPDAFLNVVSEILKMGS